MASSSMIFEGHAPQATFSAHWHWRRVWLPVMAFSLVFAVESTPYFGGDHTSEPLRRVAEALLGYDACVNWEMMHHLIRKAGHFAGYGLFSLICFRAFWTTLGGAACRMPRQLGAHGLAILLTFLVAGADARASSAMWCWIRAAAWRCVLCCFWGCRRWRGASGRGRCLFSKGR